MKNQERVDFTFRVSRKLQSQHGYGVRRTGSSFFDHKPTPALTARKDHRSLVGVHNSHRGCGIGSNTSRELFTELTFSSRNEALSGLASDDAINRAQATAWLAGHGSTRDDSRILVERLNDDSDEVRQVAEQGLWVLWTRSGDDEIDAMLVRGNVELQSGQLGDAIATFSEIVARQPDFAEGWNQRAMALFMAGELERSLADCDEVLKLNPYHFAALAGFGQIFFKQEQYVKAITYWKRALVINSNMPAIVKNIKAAEEMMAFSNLQMT